MKYYMVLFSMLEDHCPKPVLSGREPVTAVKIILDRTVELYYDISRTNVLYE
jgi:hypothetical protein